MKIIRWEQVIKDGVFSLDELPSADDLKFYSSSTVMDAKHGRSWKERLLDRYGPVIVVFHNIEMRLTYGPHGMKQSSRFPIDRGDYVFRILDALDVIRELQVKARGSKASVYLQRVEDALLKDVSSD